MAEYTQRPGTVQGSDQVASGTDGATGQTWDKAQDYTEEAKSKAQDYSEQARSKAQDYASQAEERIEEGKSQAASGMERAAEMVRERTEDAGGSTTTQAGAKVADTMETAASYMREHDMAGMWNDLESYARTHPAQAIAGAVVAGFVVGRLIR